MTLEDETGVGNIVVWPDRFERYRRITIGARLMRIEGRVQRSGIVVHVVAERLHDISASLLQLTAQRGMGSTAHLPKVLRPKRQAIVQTGRKTPREMAFKGE